MNIIKKDYKEYILNMDHKDVVFIDPPWNYDDKSPKAVNQLSYNLWLDNDKELEYIFENIKCKYLFVWCTNSFLENLFRCKHHSYKYKSIITWLKLTQNDKIFYGLGQYFRNSTEQLLLFINKKEKPLRFTQRNIIEAKHQKRTKKPHEEELKIFNQFIEKDMNKFAYIFSGLDVNIFKDLNIDLIDIAL